jgi:hypothetical protein
MAVNIFQTLRAKIEKNDAMLPMEKRAMFWFKTFYTDLMAWQRSLGKPKFSDLQQQPISKRVVSPSRTLPGFCYFFLYEPSGKDTLPFYDRFPFVLVIDRDQESFTGLNFHYLSYYWRAWLFDNLYERRQKSKDPLKVSMKFKYDWLATSPKYEQFRPCYRRYLFKNLRSPMLQVGESEWDIALWLPVELFAKESRSTIWKESEQKF